MGKPLRTLTRKSLTASIIVGMVFGIVVGASGQALSTAPTARIRTAVVDAERVTLTGTILPQISRAENLGAVDSATPLRSMILILQRGPQQESELRSFMEAQQNSSSPEFHHWLTPEELGEHFGVARVDVEAVSSWLVTHGFKIESVAPNRMSINFSGTAGQMPSAFGVSLNRYLLADGSSHIANGAELSIPKALQGVVGGIASLSDFRPAPMHRTTGVVDRNMLTGETTAPQASKLSGPVVSNYAKGTAPKAISPELTNSINPYYAVTPGDFSTIYNLAPAWASGYDGTGQSITVVAESDIVTSDVDAFRAGFGLPATKLTRYVLGANPGLSAAEDEAVLDVEWSGAVARNAMINIVIAQDSTTTAGVLLAAQYVVNTNLSPILSVSWGACELGIGISGNQFINSMWEQAAAQGISVVVSAGDSGAAVCNQGSLYATYGMSSNGFGSTIYNASVGGTDLYGSFTSPKSYWSSTNSATLSSALSYIPELPWNDSCANPQVLSVLQSRGVTDATVEALCNDASYQTSFLDVVGGSGGASNCIISNFISSTNYTCTSGYAKPSWQTGIVGATSDGSRDMPDVSFFAGDGLWGSAYVFCETDASSDGTCDFTNPTNVRYLAAGGTSFGAPAFSGVLAILAQKTSGRLGNPNPELYALAGQQFASSSLANACSTENVITGNSCIFYDVDNGSNAEPCSKSSRNCSPALSSDSYGVLPGNNGTTGYDLATGLGTLNIGNLVSSWGSIAIGSVSTSTALTMAKSSIVYGDTLTGTAVVTVASGTASGDVSVTTDGFGAGPFTLSSGTTSVTLVGMAAGSHSVVASFAGNSTFLSSTSSPVAITVSKAPTTLALISSRASLSGTEAVSIIASVGTTQFVASPTGTVTFVNQTTGATLGSITVVASADTGGHLTATASIVVSGTLLSPGTNVITATYSGETNFSATSVNSTSVVYTPAFTLASPQKSFTIPANGSASMTVTVTASSGTLVAPVLLACPASLPSFLTCSFSPAILPAGTSSGTSILTIYAAPLTASVEKDLPVRPFTPWHREVFLSALIGAGLLGWRRRGFRLLGVTIVLFGLLSVGLSGCSKGSATAVATATPSLTMQASAASLAFKTAEILTATLPSDATGSITFTDGQSSLGSSAISGGVATLSTSALALGTHSLGARYAGDTHYVTATSASTEVDVTYSLTLVVQASDGLGNSNSLSMPTLVQ